jgi:osmoprotectant transport system substrate-binding protein
VVRKHTRRAAKAAYAVSLAVAIVVGLMAAGAGAAASKPTVTIGTKNFTEQYVLGQLYKQALEANGYKVVYKENIGNSELTDGALRSGKINFYPEYAGEIVADLAHKSPPMTAAAAYAAAD